MRFGGVTAVDALDLDAPGGRITGLIGPNGAGKSTTFNGVSGAIAPAAGSVHLFGIDVTKHRPDARARLGLGRTFQRMQLVSSLSVADNVRVGPEARVAGTNPLRQLYADRRSRQRISASVSEALEVCGLSDLAREPVGRLSTGQRRLVELARALAGDFRFLILDEPSSGLDSAETAGMTEILQRWVAEREVGILLVEHDMSLVMTCCQYLYVLDFGKLIFSGTAAEVQASPVVRGAYLGDDALVPSA
jgi:ABC-type branched-subunit amino acid transport system ATPase component